MASDFDFERLRAYIEKVFEDIGIRGSCTSSGDNLDDTITLEDLREKVEMLRQAGMRRQRQHYMGIPIFESPHVPATEKVPKIQLSPDCPVSDEFRAKTNAWYIEMFGYKDKPVVFMTEYGVLASPRNMAILTDVGA